jgi:hypothetical protein
MWVIHSVCYVRALHFDWSEPYILCLCESQLRYFNAYVKVMHFIAIWEPCVVFIWDTYRWLLLYALLLSAFSHIRSFISVSWRASISYPRPNFKAYYLCRTFSRLIRECDAHDKLSIEEFWRQVNIKMAIVMFPVSRVLLYATVRRNANPAYNESHLYFVTYGHILTSESHLYSVYSMLGPAAHLA